MFLQGALSPPQVSAILPALQNVKSKYQKDSHRPAMEHCEHTNQG